jgi:hypothetical protein
MKVRGQAGFLPQQNGKGRIEDTPFLCFHNLVRLSAEELKLARTAFREVSIIKQRKRFWLVYFILLFNAVLQLMEAHSKWVWWPELGVLMLLACLGAHRWRVDRHLINRHAGNVELLRVLENREPGLTDSCPDPFVYSPFLEAWNRRLGQRAILWRLDHLLSGKGWPGPGVQL